MIVVFMGSLKSGRTVTKVEASLLNGDKLCENVTNDGGFVENLNKC